MSAYPEGYTYRLTITNATFRDLVPVRAQLCWGLWWRDGVDGQAPIAVPAGATVEAMGIRATKSNSKGYECRCAWAAREAEDPGEVALSVSVPLMAGGNRAGLDVSGSFKVSGWTGVSRLGHAFTHTLVVSSVL